VKVYFAALLFLLIIPNDKYEGKYHIMPEKPLQSTDRAVEIRGTGCLFAAIVTINVRFRYTVPACNLPRTIVPFRRIPGPPVHLAPEKRGD
jgi:hypothetical protein